MGYREIPVAITDKLAEMETLQAFAEAAASYKPVLPEPTYVLFHRLVTAVKVAVRIVFGNVEIEEPARLQPFVRHARARRFNIPFDYIEVFRQNSLWLVGTENFEWVSKTEDFIKPPKTISSDDDKDEPWWLK